MQIMKVAKNCAREIFYLDAETEIERTCTKVGKLIENMRFIPDLSEADFDFLMLKVLKKSPQKQIFYLIALLRYPATQNDHVYVLIRNCFREMSYVSRADALSALNFKRWNACIVDLRCQKLVDKSETFFLIALTPFPIRGFNVAYFRRKFNLRAEDECYFEKMIFLSGRLKIGWGYNHRSAFIQSLFSEFAEKRMCLFEEKLADFIKLMADVLPEDRMEEICGFVVEIFENRFQPRLNGALYKSKIEIALEYLDRVSSVCHILKSKDANFDEDLLVHYLNHLLFCLIEKSSVFAFKAKNIYVNLILRSKYKQINFFEDFLVFFKRSGLCSLSDKPYVDNILTNLISICKELSESGLKNTDPILYFIDVFVQEFKEICGSKCRDYFPALFQKSMHLKSLKRTLLQSSIENSVRAFCSMLLEAKKERDLPPEKRVFDENSFKSAKLFEIADMLRIGFDQMLSEKEQEVFMQKKHVEYCTHLSLESGFARVFKDILDFSSLSQFEKGKIIVDVSYQLACIGNCKIKKAWLKKFNFMAYFSRQGAPFYTDTSKEQIHIGNILEKKTFPVSYTDYIFKGLISASLD